MRYAGWGLVFLAGCIVQPQPDPPLEGADDDEVPDDAGAGDSDADTDADSDTDGDTDYGAECSPGADTVVDLETDDGLALAADFHAAGTGGAPAAVLLHMHPPSGFNRTNWPPELIDALVDAGVSVLNVDRRGAGDSEGDPADAPGPDGWLDAEAAYDHLASNGCDVDATRIAWIGASNGTTTALDFTIAAAEDDAVLDSAALVFLTGGDYTENQNTVEGARTVLEPLPILFAYQASESAWSEQFMDGAPGGWEFLEISGGHGTEIFGIDDSLAPAIVDFLSRTLAP